VLGYLQSDAVDAEPLVFSALESSHAALAIMTHHDMPKQLYREEVCSHWIPFSACCEMVLLWLLTLSFFVPLKNSLLSELLISQGIRSQIVWQQVTQPSELSTNQLKMLQTMVISKYMLIFLFSPWICRTAAYHCIIWVTKKKRKYMGTS